MSGFDGGVGARGDDGDAGGARGAPSDGGVTSALARYFRAEVRLQDICVKLPSLSQGGLQACCSNFLGWWAGEKLSTAKDSPSFLRETLVENWNSVTESVSS